MSDSIHPAGVCPLGPSAGLGASGIPVNRTDTAPAPNRHICGGGNERYRTRLFSCLLNVLRVENKGGWSGLLRSRMDSSVRFCRQWRVRPSPCPQGAQAGRAGTSGDGAFYFCGGAAIRALRRVVMTDTVTVSYLSGCLKMT